MRQEYRERKGGSEMVFSIRQKTQGDIDNKSYWSSGAKRWPQKVADKRTSLFVYGAALFNSGSRGAALGRQRRRCGLT